jgi:aryl-alcohol dehydrogenase-like predicted oxidoreductase/ferredoxin
MSIGKIGRRKFLKGVSAALLGAAAPSFLNVNPSSGKPGKPSASDYRTLGKTGLKVTAVGMGVMNCSDPAVLQRAFDLGINFYDTADCYMRGKNEEMVGKVFQGRRDKVFIQTKVHDHDEKQMRQSVERSLRRLRTDYIDVLVWHDLHRPEEVSDERLFEFMAKMKKEGKVRFTGFSSHSNMASLLKEAARGTYHDVALVSYNFTHSKVLGEAIAQASNAGIGVVAMKTQAGGYKKGKAEGVTPHQAALKYVLSDRNVATAVPGVTTLEQIDECAAVMGGAVTKGDLERLREHHAFLKGRICTLCGGCTGECPSGVPYGDYLRAMMYHDGYGRDELAKETLGAVLASQAADSCAECPSCTITCRRGLDIRAEIERARHFFV